MGGHRYIVASPRDMRAASARSGHTVNLGYVLGAEGLRRDTRTIAAMPQAEIMGVSDAALGYTLPTVERVCADISCETASMRYTAVLFDFERDFMQLYPFVARLSEELAGRGIKHYLPERFMSAAPAAVAVASAAVSGGSFDGMARSFIARAGEAHAAFELPPLRADFTLPSSTSDGRNLSAQELKKLIDERAAQIFFSRELRCRYFTYRSSGETHFVLFDDADTLLAKITCIEALGGCDTFMLYSDWAELTEGTLEG